MNFINFVSLVIFVKCTLAKNLSQTIRPIKSEILDRAMELCNNSMTETINLLNSDEFNRFVQLNGNRSSYFYFRENGVTMATYKEQVEREKAKGYLACYCMVKEGNVPISQEKECVYYGLFDIL